MFHCYLRLELKLIYRIMLVCSTLCRRIKGTAEKYKTVTPEEPGKQLKSSRRKLKVSRYGTLLRTEVIVVSTILAAVL